MTRIQRTGNIEWHVEGFRSQKKQEVQSHITDFLSRADANNILFQVPKENGHGRSYDNLFCLEDVHIVFVPHAHKEWGEIVCYEYESGGMGEDNRTHLRGTVFYRKAR